MVTFYQKPVLRKKILFVIHLGTFLNFLNILKSNDIFQFELLKSTN